MTPLLAYINVSPLPTLVFDSSGKLKLVNKTYKALTRNKEFEQVFSANDLETLKQYIRTPYQDEGSDEMKAEWHSIAGSFESDDATDSSFKMRSRSGSVSDMESETEVS
jgi:hypothetical protein